MKLSVVRKAYQIENGRCGQEGFKFMSEAAHKRGIPNQCQCELKSACATVI